MAFRHLSPCWKTIIFLICIKSLYLIHVNKRLPWKLIWTFSPKVVKDLKVLSKRIIWKVKFFSPQVEFKQQTSCQASAITPRPPRTPPIFSIFMLYKLLRDFFKYLSFSCIVFNTIQYNLKTASIYQCEGGSIFPESWAIFSSKHVLRNVHWHSRYKAFSFKLSMESLSIAAVLEKMNKLLFHTLSEGK